MIGTYQELIIKLSNRRNAKNWLQHTLFCKNAFYKNIETEQLESYNDLFITTAYIFITTDYIFKNSMAVIIKSK